MAEGCAERGVNARGARHAAEGQGPVLVALHGDDARPVGVGHAREAVRPMTVALHLYAGDPPPLTEVIDRLHLVEDCTYLTANSAIQRQRVDEGLHPIRRVTPDGQVALAFFKAIRQVMGRPTLSRTEQRVLFRRAVGHLDLPPRDVGRLRRDAALWVDALAQLEATGHPMDTEALVDLCATRQLAELVEVVRTTVRRMQEATEDGRLSFERTVRDWIAEASPLGPQLVMEGFTFLTPLQHFLIDSAAARGVAVHVLVPYRPGQPALFTQVRATYEPWWTGEAGVWETPSSGEPELVALQERLFTGSGYPLTAPSVTVRQ